MSKKKGKAAAKQGPKKAKRASASRRTAAAATTAAAGRTSQITVFIYRTPNGNRIRTAPQKAYAGPGHVEWTVVNLVDGSEVPVTISWPNGGPWGKAPEGFRSCFRRSVDDAMTGTFKYVVSALDATEDPELEIPEM